MPAIAYQKTAVIDQPWDGPGAEAKLKTPLTSSVANAEYAWRGTGDETTKANFKFPHHQVASDGTPGAANVNGVRNALARLSGANIPSADESGVKAHLQHHLDDFNAGKPKSELLDDAGFGVLDPGMFVGRIWAVSHDFAIAMQQGLRVMNSISRADMAEMEAQIEASIEAGPMTVPTQSGKGVAVIPLSGIITPKPSFLSMLFGGGGGLSGFTRQLNSAVGNPDVSHIILNVDSPGGSTDMVPETAALIRKAGESKPIVAVANTQAASAAYWLASQAHEVNVTPSGSVGSVGVYKLHQDLSEAHAMRGIKPTLVSAGDHKVDGNPFEPLNDEALNRAKQDVGDFYNMFVGDVARGRGVANPGVDGDAFGGGNMDIGKRAVKSGLADKVATLNETIGRLTSGRARVKNARASKVFIDGDLEDLDDDDECEDDDDDATEGARRFSPDDKTALADILMLGRFGH